MKDYNGAAVLVGFQEGQEVKVQSPVIISSFHSDAVVLSFALPFEQNARFSITSCYLPSLMLTTFAIFAKPL